MKNGTEHDMTQGAVAVPLIALRYHWYSVIFFNFFIMQWIPSL